MDPLYVQLRHMANKDLDVQQLLSILPHVICTVHAPGEQKKRVAMELVSMLLTEAQVDPGLVGDALQVASVGIDTLIGVRTGAVGANVLGMCVRKKQA